MQKMAIDENDLKTPAKRRKITVSVVRCERAGLVTACLLADAGFKVFCVDSDQSIVNDLKRGVSTFDEPGLEPLLKKNVKGKRLLAISEIEKTVPKSSVVLLFVPPRIDQKKRADYSDIEKACMDVGLNLRSGTLVILTSDLAPGVTETLVKDTLEMGSGLKAGPDFGLAYCSIQLTPGRGLRELVNYPRFLGAIDERSSDFTSAFLSTITKGEVVEVSDMRTAEAVRMFENVYRDVNVALANELAGFCEEAKIDFMEARSAVNSRVHCWLFAPQIVSDYVSDGSLLLTGEAESLRVKLRTATLARKTNDAFLNQIFYLVKDALRSCGRTIRRARILVLGASCRPNVKEARGSFVRELVEILRSKGMLVKVHDPLLSYKELTELGYNAERTLTKAVKGMDCLLIAVGHSRFRRLNLRRIKLLMRKPSAIVDISHVVDPSAAEENGFLYRGLGRGVWTR